MNIILKIFLCVTLMIFAGRFVECKNNIEKTEYSVTTSSNNVDSEILLMNFAKRLADQESEYFATTSSNNVDSEILLMNLAKRLAD